jgi:SWI/SNF and RSC complexes subunit Ssr4 C-terminal
MTSYVRRRFHLIQGGNPQLWLLHYLRAPDEDRLPASQPQQTFPPRPFPLPNIAKVEFVLGPQGQLVSFKNPSTQWTPSFPQQTQTQFPGSGYTPQFRGRQPVPPQGIKRVKIEEEEDDEVLIPRDVAAGRYVRWTEWMEEIISSGYHIRMLHARVALI